jgi:hypothetical protein
MLALFADSMHLPASNSGRKAGPSLIKLFALMAGFFVVFVILAELASATTNDQPASSLTSNQIPVSTTVPEPSAPTEEVVAETPATPSPRSLSYGANEVVKMYKGGVKADVLLTYIESSSLSYLLSSREILYLSQLGVPSEIVNAMIRRDHDVELAKANARQSVVGTSEAMTPPMPAPVVYSQPVVVVQQPKVKYVGNAPVCSTPVCSTVSQPNANVTVIGSRYGSTFFNGCYYGPFSCSSPARAYYNAEFGPRGWSSSYCDFGYRDRFAAGGYGFGRRHFGRF